MDESPPPQAPSPMTIDGADEDKVLSNSAVLTRREVIARRLRRVKQLARCYRGHYWALMEDLKSKYREYYWTYGKSPFKDDERGGVVSGDRVNGTDNAVVSGDDFVRCAFSGCKSKAMALTRFCHAHILLDSKQMLYRGCTTVAKKWAFLFFIFFKCLVLWCSNSWSTSVVVCLNNLVSWNLENSLNFMGILCRRRECVTFFFIPWTWYLVVWVWRRWIRVLEETMCVLIDYVCLWLLVIFLSFWVQASRFSV